LHGGPRRSRLTGRRRELRTNRRVTECDSFFAHSLDDGSGRCCVHKIRRDKT
jgi:uncharacterized cysteine cluster protein YcgN (CxxCxxCC family)